MKNTNRDMASGNIPRLMARLSIPAVVAQIVNLLYSIVDRVYIGHIPGVGTAALTGVGLFMPILMLINAFAILASAGGAPRAAIAMGRGDNKAAERIMGNCFSAVLIIAALLTVTITLSAPTLLRMFGSSEVTLPYALSYTRIYVLGCVTMLVVMGMNPFITTQGFAATSMLTTVIGAVINIILDPILIFGLNMGVEGAAIATVFSQGVGAVWVLRFLTGKRTILRLRLPNMRLEKRIIMPCLALGISSFVMVSTESLLIISFNTQLSRFGGDLAVGAMTIMSSLYQLVPMPLQGICQGGQPIMSYNFGAGNRERVKKAFYLQFGLCMCYSTLFCAATMLFPRLFVKAFSADQQLIEYATWTLRIYLAGCFATGSQISCQQGFMALGQAKISLFMACLRKLILLIPLIYILPVFFADKVFAVFLAEPISDFLASTTTGVIFFTRFNRILDHDPTAIE